MSFKDYCPVTIWLGKRLSSGTPRLIILCMLILFLGLNLLFRTSAAISAHHILEITKSLSQLTVGKTIDWEVLELVSSAHSRLLSDPSCAAEECKLLELSNWDRPVLWLLVRNAPFHRVAYFLGYRAYQFEAFFRFQKNTLTGSGYRLIVDDGSFGYPGGVVINVSAVAESGVYGHHYVSTERDESPEYQVGASRKFEGHSLNVSYGPSASNELVQHAFDVKLGCLVTLRRCQEVRQILPDVWQDRISIKAAKEARLRSPEPCPQRIVRNLANNATQIYRLKVLEINKSDDIDHRNSSNEATFTLIEVLKEEFDHRSNTQESIEKRDFRSLRIPDTANSWMSRGQTVIMFYECDEYWNSPCAVVLADPGNLDMVMAAIPQSSEPPHGRHAQIEEH
jgi:hypothetical protein